MPLSFYTLSPDSAYLYHIAIDDVLYVCTAELGEWFQSILVMRSISWSWKILLQIHTV